VSNKTSDAADGASDPIEVLLYSVLMASSGRLTVRELAGILQVDLARLQAALSLAARLGFAKRMGDGECASCVCIL
jgi:predicted transcriptional regulator